MAELVDLDPIYRGEAITLNVTMNPVENITGWSISLRVKQDLGDTDPLITVAGTITNGPLGEFSVTLSEAQTATLTGDAYVYDIWRTDFGAATVLDIGAMPVQGSVRIQ